MKKSYPKGHLNQHKRLATGQSLQKPNTADKGGDMNESGRVSNKHFSSSGSTGSGVNKKVPGSTTVPDRKGPKGHNVPKSTMTNY